MLKTSFIKIFYLIFVIMGVVLYDQYYSHTNLDSVQVKSEIAKKVFLNSSNEGIEKSKVSLLGQASSSQNNSDFNSNTSIQALKDPSSEKSEDIDKEDALAKLNKILDPEASIVVSRMFENPKLKSIISHVISSNLSKEEILALLSKYRDLSFQNEEREVNLTSVDSDSIGSKTSESDTVLQNENPYKELQENPQGLLRRLEASSSELTPDNPYYDLVNSQANSKQSSKLY